MQWVLIGLAAFVAWKMIQDGKKNTPPVCPSGTMPMQQLSDSNSTAEKPIYTGECVPNALTAKAGGSNIPIRQWFGTPPVESVGPAYSTGANPWNPVPLSQAVLMAMSDVEIAGLAVWAGGEEARTEPDRRGLRFTYTQWHALKSAAQGRDGSGDADLHALGQSDSPLTAAEFRAVDHEWTRVNAVGG